MKKIGGERKSHMWTKEEIRTVIKLWETKSLTEIAAELRLSEPQIAYMANEIRKVNPNAIPKKRRRGFLKSLITEVLNDR